MTKEKVIELYNKYQEADYEFHKYIDQFFTVTINGQITKEATSIRLPKDELIMQELDKAVDTARIEYENAFKEWLLELKQF